MGGKYNVRILLDESELDPIRDFYFHSWWAFMKCRWKYRGRVVFIMIQYKCRGLS